MCMGRSFELSLSFIQAMLLSIRLALSFSISND